MPSLSEVLSRIPGLAGYQAQVQANNAQGLNTLQMAQGAGSLMQMIQQQEAKKRADQEVVAMKGIMAQTQGKPELAIPALIQMGTPTSIKLAAELKAFVPKPAEPYTLGNQRRGPNNELLAEAPFRPQAEQKPPESWSDPYTLGGAMVQKNNATGQIRTAVTREPQTRINMPQPVTPVTIQDPNDPTGMSTIVIDGRTKAVLGKGPKMTEAGKIDAKTQLMMTGLEADLRSAEDLLTGIVRTSDGQIIKGNLPTGSGLGSLYDTAAGFFGASPSGAAEADSLKTVSARLVSRIPRFEGPQSDKDVALYQKASGDAGNEKLPRGRRLAAIKTMRSIYEGYESGRRGRLVGNRRASDQVRGAQPNVVDFNSLPE